MLGIDKEFDTRKKKNVQWEICILSSKEGRPELSSDEENDLRTDWEFKHKANEVPSIDASQSNLVSAKMRGDGVLARWREKREKLIDEKKNDKANKLHPDDIEMLK